ncbi:MAG: hypothetical protein GY772_15345, partial [bacterium]|nr:hypothetical protein [bacterium]
MRVEDEAAEICAFRQQFDVISATLEEQDAQGLRVELVAAQSEVHRHVTDCAQLRDQLQNAVAWGTQQQQGAAIRTANQTIDDPRIMQLTQEIQACRRRLDISETHCDMQAKRLVNLKFEVDQQKAEAAATAAVSAVLTDESRDFGILEEEMSRECMYVVQQQNEQHDALMIDAFQVRQQ